MLPNFIGIGAPKAATTWLFRCLQEHPEVFVSPYKDTYFFDTGSIDGRLAEYEQMFNSNGTYIAIGEISTRYLTSDRAPERIKRHIPRARLFVSLRNPIDQVYSHYWHLARQNFHQWEGTVVPRSFEEAVRTYEERLLEPAYYFKHLQRWLRYFDRSQLHIIFYDDIQSRPREVLTGLYGFLEVEATFEPPSMTRRDSSVREGTSPRSPMHARIHSSLYDRLNRRVYYPFKQLVGPRTAIRVKDALRVRPIMEYLFQRKGYPQMPSQARAFLCERFAKEIQNLATLAGRDLSHWT